MDYQKLDAGLAGALEEVTEAINDELPVSVRTKRPLSSTEQAELRHLGGQGVDSGLGIYSATVNRASLAELSKKPWVRLVSLARPLKPS
jgi:hypothetical protein